MRTAIVMMFASLFLSLLAACAPSGDVDLPGPSDVDVEVPAAMETVKTAQDTGPSENGANATPAPAVVPPASPTQALHVSEPISPAASSDQPLAVEEYTFDPSLWQAGLASLGSFRQKAVLDFTATASGTRSKVTYEGEATLEPSAVHSLVRVEGQGAAQLPTNQVEVIWIDDQVWVKIGLKPWASVPATAVRSKYGGEVVGVADLLPFIAGARRVLPDEKVNGIPAMHYVYDVKNLESDVGMTSARGDLWVARSGGYVVRLTLDGQGTYYNTYTTSGALRLVYDLYDVGVPLAISPPR